MGYQTVIQKPMISVTMYASMNDKELYTKSTESFIERAEP